MKGVLAVTVIVLLSFVLPANAQWLNHPTPNIPRTPNGKPNLAAPATRGADAHPDLSGVWTTGPAVAHTARHRSRRCPRCSDDRRCHAQWIRYPTPGIPRLADGKPNLGMIIQASSVKIILYEEASTFRQFFLDGRKLPDHRQPT